MTKVESLPYSEPLFSTHDACAILSTKRNTLAAQMKRYDHYLRKIGLEPGARGVPRSFTMEQLGLYAVVQSAFPVKQADAVLESIDRLAPKAGQIYSTAKAHLWDYGGSGERRPRFDPVEKPVYLEGRNFFGSVWLFEPVDSEKSSYGNIDWNQISDLAGYPIARILLPFEATLRHAWSRAIWLRAGFQFDADERSVEECE